jgi:hypothetical protein
MASALHSMAPVHASMVSVLDSIASVLDSIASVLDSIASVLGSMASVLGSMASVLGSMASALGSMASVVDSLTFELDSMSSVVDSLTGRLFFQGSGASSRGPALTSWLLTTSSRSPPLLVVGKPRHRVRRPRRAAEHRRQRECRRAIEGVTIARHRPRWTTSVLTPPR